MTPLTQAQRDLLVQAHDSHESGGIGISARALGDNRPVVDELIIMGLLQWHPPRVPASLIPTPLGQERVVELRKRQKAAKKGARTGRRERVATFALIVHLEPQGALVQGDTLAITGRILDPADNFKPVDPTGFEDFTVTVQPPTGDPTTMSFLGATATKLAVGTYETTFDTSAAAGDYEIEVAVTGDFIDRVQRWVHVNAALDPNPTPVAPSLYDGGAPDTAFAFILDGGTPTTIYALTIDGGTP